MSCLRENFTSSSYGEGLETGRASVHRASPLPDKSTIEKMKDTLSVGQAQLWNVTSVPKQPVLSVAAYSALLLASLQAFGTDRGAAYAELPKWRKRAHRPSCLDLIALLRKEMVDHPELIEKFSTKVTDSGLIAAAAA